MFIPKRSELATAAPLNGWHPASRALLGAPGPFRTSRLFRLLLRGEMEPHRLCSCQHRNLLSPESTFCPGIAWLVPRENFSNFSVGVFHIDARLCFFLAAHSIHSFHIRFVSRRLASFANHIVPSSPYCLPSAPHTSTACCLAHPLSV